MTRWPAGAHAEAGHSAGPARGQAVRRAAGAGGAGAGAGEAADLLLLDEPLASLDPLARREFLRTLMDAVAESGLTVLLSSHIIGDLERVCDYLIILSAAHVQLAGDIGDRADA